MRRTPYDEVISCGGGEDSAESAPDRRQREKQIDSAGVALSLALNGVERGAGEPDIGQFSVMEQVKAVTGAAAIYRMSALRDIVFGENEIFDEDFFAYKEDVDLGWRLNNREWKVLFVPVGIGVHKRSFGKKTDLSWKFRLKSFYKRISDVRTRYSLRNWVWTTVKNATFKQMFLHELFFDARLLVFFIFSLGGMPSFVYPAFLLFQCLACFMFSLIKLGSAIPLK